MTHVWRRLKRASLAYILNNMCNMNNNLLLLLISYPEAFMQNNNVHTTQTSQSYNWIKVKGGSSQKLKEVENLAIQCTNKFSCLMEENKSLPNARKEKHSPPTNQNYVNQSLESAYNNEYPGLSEELVDDVEENHRGCTRRQHDQQKLRRKLSPRTLNQREVLLVADSQGRDMASKLDRVMGRSYKVFGHIQPGALLEKVIEPLHSLQNNPISMSHKDKDWIIIMGGCNDLANPDKEYKVDLFTKELISTLENQVNRHTDKNIIISTIPYRYDLPSGDKRQNVVVKVNEEIRKLIQKSSHVHLLDLWLLERFCHTKHGFHLNNKGKMQVSELIYKIIIEKHEEQKIGHVFQEMPELTNIKVIDQDMSDVFKKRRCDPSVAFAHCISGDFGHERQMTAGVAVKFKREFGKPTIWDCIDDHLTYQRSVNGAGVYGLVTKLNYNGKPLPEDYDEAFSQLTKSFKHKNFKQLICSPLGCVRDKVPLRHFISKIIQFHKETGAKIEIVAYKQNSVRSLNNGLSHNQFINAIKSLLQAEAVPKQTTIPVGNPENQILANSLSPVTPSSPWRGWPSIGVGTTSPGIYPTRLQFNEGVRSNEKSSECQNKKQSSVVSEVDADLSNLQCATETTPRTLLVTNSSSSSLACSDKSFL